MTVKVVLQTAVTRTTPLAYILTSIIDPSFSTSHYQSHYLVSIYNKIRASKIPNSSFMILDKICIEQMSSNEMYRCAGLITTPKMLRY